MAAPVLVQLPGDVLSPSAASRYLGCGAQYFFGKIAKLPDPPTGALTLGSAVHAAITANFEQKIESKVDIDADGAVALFREAWSLKVRGEFPERAYRQPLPTEFRDDEDPAELKAMGETLVRKYMEEAAPAIEPAAVELPVSGSIGGVMVRGFIDLVDVHGKVIDVKTASKKPSGISSDYRFQLATYMQLGGISGARLDTLTKTKKPALIQEECTIDQSDIDATAKIYPLVQRSIRAGHFIPNRSHYRCSRKYCAFWRQCEREFGGKVAE